MIHGFPDRFAISSRAIGQMEQIKEQILRTGDSADPVLAIGWADAYVGLDRKPGPIVGMYHRSQIIEDHEVRKFGSVDVIFSLPIEYHKYFYNKTMDFENGEFIIKESI